MRAPQPTTDRRSRRLGRGAAAALVAAVVTVVLAAGAFASPAAAQTATDPTTAAPITDPADPAPPGAPAAPTAPAAPVEPNSVTINLDTGEGATATSQPLTIVLLLTVMALAPAMLILLTSFTRIVIVLGLTRNAMNLQGVPPNQVLIGLGLFLTLFVMAPVFNQANEEALQPFLAGEIDQSEAFDRGMEPFREFMFAQTREADLAMFTEMADDERPRSRADVATTTLIPAFVISELRAAFLIGFVIFIPFLVIDMVTSATLMSMGMVMLPPVLISLPFKLLLFVVVDGWALIIQSVVQSFH